MANMTSNAGRATVLVYSPLAQTRASVRTAVGRRPSGTGAWIDWLECQTDRRSAGHGRWGRDLAILDGEAQDRRDGIVAPVRYEITDCPPIVVLVARKQDVLCQNGLADAVIAQPIDPIAAAATVADLLIARAREIPVVR
jgi:hypothetical protein